MIPTVWSKDDFSPKLQERKIVVMANDKSTLLTTRDKETIQKTEIPSLVSTQEETDTRVVLYAKYAQEHGYDYAQINTPDSDIFFILLHYAASLSPTKILYKTGSGNGEVLWRRLFYFPGGIPCLYTL